MDDKIRIISDGFSCEWQLCDKEDCQLHVVRPGKAQCDLCDENKIPDQNTSQQETTQTPIGF